MRKAQMLIKQFIKKNSSHLLAGAAIGFGIAACTSAVQSTDKYKELSGKAETKMDKIKAGIKAYWPSLLLGGSAIGCVVGLDVTSMKKIQSISDAYRSLKKTAEYHIEESERYRKKVEEKNPELHKEVQEECKVERTNNMPEPVHLFCFKWNREEVWFEDTSANELDAEIEILGKFIKNDYISMNDIAYSFVHEEGKFRNGYMFGFNKHGDEYGLPNWIKFDKPEKKLKDGRTYIEITLNEPPYYSYESPDDFPPDFREYPELSVENTDAPPFK